MGNQTPGIGYTVSPRSGKGGVTRCGLSAAIHVIDASKSIILLFQVLMCVLYLCFLFSISKEYFF